MGAAGVPLVPGYHGNEQDIDLMKLEADKIGYPIIIKPTHGGGGKVCDYYYFDIFPTIVNGASVMGMVMQNTYMKTYTCKMSYLICVSWCPCIFTIIVLLH